MSLWWLLPILFCVFVLAMAGIWIYKSYATFPLYLKPGATYQVKGETRMIPKLPHKRYGSSQEASLDRSVPVLSEEDLAALDEVVGKAIPLLNESGVTYWFTGGSLISAMLWGHPMCYDDDADIHVLFSEKDTLWTPDFMRRAAEKDLEVFVMRGVKRDYAPTREMSALRLRRKNTYHPVVDIFFMDWDEEQTRWAHVNGWREDRVYFDHQTEVWEKEWLFPLQQKTMTNGQVWTIPAQPAQMLDKHYGPEWQTTIKSPSPLLKSHKWAFWISHTFGAWKVLTEAAPGI